MRPHPLASLLLAAPAFAAPQATAEPPAAAATASVRPAADEILVTARRRAEGVQDVPIAVSVVGEQQLEVTGSYNVQRLQQLQPSLQFFASNPRNSAINIRGLGAPFGLTNDGIEQGVGLYIDQVYYSRPAAASFDFLDVERIEVLRGPQSTLYGKNTTAGALNITTRAPSFTPEARAEATGGNLDFVQLKGSVSGPLIPDRLAARLAVTFTSREGTLFNTTTRRRVNEQDNIGLRGSLLWTPNAETRVTLAADWNHQDAECCTQVFVRVAPTLRAPNRQFAGLAALFNYRPPSTEPFDRLTDVDGALQARQEFGGVSLLAERRFEAGTLTSVTAFRFWDWFPLNDRDFIGLPITTVSSNFSKQRQYTQELRFASEGGGRLDYVVGLFGYHQTIATNSLQEQGAAASGWLLGPAQFGNPALLNGLRQATPIRYKNDSAALFGRLTWRLADTLELTPGLRLNYDRKSVDYSATVTGGLANPTPAQQALKDGVLAAQAYQRSFSDWNLSGDVTLSWKPADGLLAYATYARAFKSAGLNLSGLPNDAAGRPALALAVVKPETVNHYEVGLKTEPAPAVTLNLSAYWTDIRDYQATVVNGQIGVLRGYLANAARVRVRGAEAELQWRPAANLSLYANGAYTDAEYVSFPDAPPPIEQSGGTVQFVDISGQRLPGVSKWSGAIGGQLDLPVDDARRFYVGADASARSSFSSNPTPSRFTDIAGYALLSLRAGYATDDGWNLFGWVRNLFDARYFDFLSVQPGNSGLIVGQPGDPRTYGATLSRRF